MAKARRIATYRSIKNPDALAACARDAGLALQAAGGRILARGNPACHAAHEKLEVAVERDLRFVEAVS